MNKNIENSNDFAHEKIQAPKLFLNFYNFSNFT